MKITSLETQKKNKNRFNLYIDDAFYCGVEIGTAARLGFHEGKEVTASELSRINHEEEYQQCMNAALNLASRRPQSEREYWQKLGKKYEKPVIGRCLDRLRELGYANDERFTEIWVRERSKTRGKKLLEAELREKGIDISIITTALASINTDSEIESALGLAQKKFRLDRTYDENYSRIISLLTRKGYSYSVSKKIFEEINKTPD